MSDIIKIKLRNPNEVMLSSRGFSLDGRSVGLLKADVEIEGIDKLTRRGAEIWQDARGAFDIPDWWNGIVRIDFLVTSDEVSPIEINVLGPECIAAFSQAYLAHGRSLGLENPVELFARYLHEWADGRTILFLLADNESPESKSLVKRTWGPALLTCLQATRLNIRPVSSEKFLSAELDEFEGCALFAFGDVVPSGARLSQFTRETCERLSYLQFCCDVPVFNSIFPKGVDPGNKLLFERMLGRDPIELDSVEKLESVGSKEYRRWVLKPSCDTGGNGILNGGKTDYRAFFDRMALAIEQGGHFLSRRLEPITVTLAGKRWIPDVNLAYVARGCEAHPLHAVVRLKPIEEFNVDGTTNVSQGACMAYRIPLPEFV